MLNRLFETHLNKLYEKIKVQYKNLAPTSMAQCESIMENGVLDLQAIHTTP